jgi:NTE family protein
VAASSAVRGLWPPVTIGGRRYMDGGVHSMENADLAAGFDRVLVIAPERATLPWASLDLDLAGLRAAGARAEVIAAGPGMREAVAAVGGDVLDPAVRGPAAGAGREQGRAAAAAVAALWR